MIPFNSLFAEAVSRSVFEWGRIQTNSDWAAPIAVAVGLMLFVRYMYVKDSVELSPVWGWILGALRSFAILALLVFYLQPHWRIEKETIRPSRVVALVDTSMSMGITDRDLAPSQLSGSADAKSNEAARNRVGQLIDAFEKTDLLNKLRAVHEVTVVPFSDRAYLDRAVVLPKLLAEKNPVASPKPKDSASPESTGEKSIDWTSVLELRGSETRLGQALIEALQSQRGSPLAGVIAFTDGAQNAGASPDLAVSYAQDSKTPIFAVGLGSDAEPAHVRVSDFSAPARAYPGDPFSVVGYLQARRLQGKTATVQLLSRSARDEGKEGTGAVLQSREVTLPKDGEALAVKFEITPQELGRSTFSFRVLPPKEDLRGEDHFREADVDIVDRKNHVLLFAGGPNRDYQYLRTMLYRDKTTKLEVLLQTAAHGASQEGKMLDSFPKTREELFDYDCIVAFDPDWKALSPEQASLIENWVSEQGGGLIVIAGAINSGRAAGDWTQDPRMSSIRNLYPVEFPRRFSSSDSSAQISDEPWPLEFTREGEEADFLAIGERDDAKNAWNRFAGVYSYCPLRGAKPGAVVYSRFSDPKAATIGQAPVFFAGQFYGSGRTFFIGSAEMWRLRTLDEAYFTQFYTKLIRHVSQGRLLRDSSRGVLLTNQDRYMIGNSIEARAQLTDARREPLRAAEIDLRVAGPNGAAQNVKLAADSNRPGSFVGQFPATLEGAYRLELPIPESDGERLVRRVQVRMPELESEHPQRNDALLRAVAKNSGGKYYVGIPAVFDRDEPLASAIKDRTAVVIQAEPPNPRNEEPLMRTLLIVIFAALCLEWTLRRLLKLA